ncbi:glycosyltransferase family 4 protein [Desulfosporosinus shakirovi]|uniref:glycosyltransferase family 4 protein n=1 Tax=Desulfosporosinus shakirovi TaxID=2885154 RepID=UPI001E4CAFDA|nr:glycosyltransferase family 4 protein [Desulfosporosinus sp. SRJS8]MCB8817601.1 glycosyltransferase family 4 protein [Desulfosporosinus sp. SRJS8]
MKIAMIGHKRIPSREGGIEIAVEELSTRLVAAGHTVHVYNRKGHHVSGRGYDGKSNGKNLKEYKGIRIITVPTLHNAKFNALVYSMLGTFSALFGRYDCIHYHAEGPCAMLWIPHLFGIRTVATIHGLDWQRAKWGGFAIKYLKFGEKIAAKYADEVIVLSENAQQYFMDTYGREVKFIPNGIEKPGIKSDAVIREKFGIQKDEYILFLARIVPEKGLHYLIDAFREVNTIKKLVVAGGSSHTDAYMTDIKRKAREDERVVFTDFVQGEVLEELYSNAYVYVLPSDIEGMPISLLEAMSYGNCCLVSDIAENTEVVEDKACSFKKSVLEDLRRKLEWLVQNPTVVNGYRREASEYICGRFNWAAVVEKTVELYRKRKKR